MLELLSAIGGIILADIVLSGDNALVIGAVAAGLPQRQRRPAIVLGGASAVVLRIAFAFIASFLLRLPWLQAAGGVVLLIIAIRLLVDQQHNQPEARAEQSASLPQQTQEETRLASRGFISGLLTILVADVTMSLDNVLAVGALSHGNFLVLSIGILLSITILLLGSSLVAALMKQLPWLLDIAALVLAWTGANMMLNDLHLGNILDNHPWTSIAVPAISLGIVLVADIFLRLRKYQQARNLAR
ncbi:MAG: YjbE family putative metal transport protein [Ktedonobacteraceae bacterium]